MFTEEFIKKYEQELVLLYGAKILYPDTWRHLECSDTVKSIGGFLFNSDDAEFEPFKRMIKEPLEYIEPRNLTSEGLTVSITAGRISIKLNLKSKSIPDFEKFGMDNLDCRYPGKHVVDGGQRRANYANWLIEKFKTPEYMEQVDLRVEKISFF